MTFIHNINPVLLSLGPVEIRYYGLVYVIGFLLTLFILLNQSRSVGLKKDDVYDYLLYLIVGVLIGARLFEVLIWSPSYFFANPGQILAFWNGGMSFHGGLFGAVVVSYFYAKKKKLRFYKLADLLVLPTSLMLFFGRIANFINGEIYGKITNVSWGVKFPNAEGYRHPTQIYEAFKNLFNFFVLWVVKTKKDLKKWNLPDGFVFWLFFLLYGTFRFLIEFIKYNENYLLGLSTGQYLCLVMLIIGIVGMFSIFKKKNKNVSKKK